MSYFFKKRPQRLAKLDTETQEHSTKQKSAKHINSSLNQQVMIDTRPFHPSSLSVESATVTSYSPSPHSSFTSTPSTASLRSSTSSLTTNSSYRTPPFFSPTSTDTSLTISVPNVFASTYTSNYPSDAVPDNFEIPSTVSNSPFSPRGSVTRANSLEAIGSQVYSISRDCIKSPSLPRSASLEIPYHPSSRSFANFRSNSMGSPNVSDNNFTHPHPVFSNVVDIGMQRARELAHKASPSSLLDIPQSMSPHVSQVSHSPSDCATVMQPRSTHSPPTETIFPTSEDTHPVAVVESPFSPRAPTPPMPNERAVSFYPIHGLIEPPHVTRSVSSPADESLYATHSLSSSEGSTIYPASAKVDFDAGSRPIRQRSNSTPLDVLGLTSLRHSRTPSLISLPQEHSTISLKGNSYAYPAVSHPSKGEDCITAVSQSSIQSGDRDEVFCIDILDMQHVLHSNPRLPGPVINFIHSSCAEGWCKQWSIEAIELQETISKLWKEKVHPVLSQCLYPKQLLSSPSPNDLPLSSGILRQTYEQLKHKIGFRKGQKYETNDGNNLVKNNILNNGKNSSSEFAVSIRMPKNGIAPRVLLITLNGDPLLTSLLPFLRNKENESKYHARPSCVESDEISPNSSFIAPTSLPSMHCPLPRISLENLPPLASPVKVDAQLLRTKKRLLEKISLPATSTLSTQSADTLQSKRMQEMAQSSSSPRTYIKVPHSNIVMLSSIPEMLHVNATSQNTY